MPVTANRPSFRVPASANPLHDPIDGKIDRTQPEKDQRHVVTQLPETLDPPGPGTVGKIGLNRETLPPILENGNPFEQDPTRPYVPSDALKANQTLGDFVGIDEGHVWRDQQLRARRLAGAVWAGKDEQ